jgi:hypothetical protein
MISSRKSESNQENSRTSTGPKSPAGKARAASNSRRHGLAAAANQGSRAEAETEALARSIAGKTFDPEIMVHARRIAEAQSFVKRVERAAALSSRNLCRSSTVPIKKAPTSLTAWRVLNVTNGAH